MIPFIEKQGGFVFRNRHPHVCQYCGADFLGPHNAKVCEGKACKAELLRRRNARKAAKYAQRKAA
jgi:hypothetical protein